ncbi:conserved protein of unknown function [Ectopseudomonas oleovorans]|uniref:Uncharacterized protein n=1 Tax=Ectopseudomonas oleovorans TaxID=301 RepID=A0A653B6Z7_ECTOL|nr:conserved protein of unknown function [Pseudomonas oleovorans]
MRTLSRNNSWSELNIVLGIMALPVSGSGKNLASTLAKQTLGYTGHKRQKIRRSSRCLTT